MVRRHGLPVHSFDDRPRNTAFCVATAASSYRTLRDLLKNTAFHVAMNQRALRCDLPVLTHRFTVENYLNAFETMRSGQPGKMVLEW